MYGYVSCETFFESHGRDIGPTPGRKRENRTTRYPVFPPGMATGILENMSHPVVKALKNPYQQY
jgi:hypothetical protein